jgi:hypothetical protein
MVDDFFAHRKQIKKSEVLMKNQSLFLKFYSPAGSILSALYNAFTGFTGCHHIYNLSLSTFLALIHKSCQSIDYSSLEMITNIEDRVNAMLDQLRKRVVPGIIAGLKCVLLPQHLLPASVILEAVA